MKIKLWILFIVGLSVSLFCNAGVSQNNVQNFDKQKTTGDPKNLNQDYYKIAFEILNLHPKNDQDFQQYIYKFANQYYNTKNMNQIVNSGIRFENNFTVKKKVSIKNELVNNFIKPYIIMGICGIVIWEMNNESNPNIKKQFLNLYGIMNKWLVFTYFPSMPWQNYSKYMKYLIQIYYLDALLFTTSDFTKGFNISLVNNVYGKTVLTIHNTFRAFKINTNLIVINTKNGIIISTLQSTKDSTSSDNTQYYLW